MAKRKQRPHAKLIRDPDAAPLVEIVLIWDWREKNGHLFRSDTSLRWHLRQYRDAYVSAGAILRFGDRDFVDPPKFEAVLRAIGVRAADTRAVVEHEGAVAA